jgi:hypothetical protein
MFVAKAATIIATKINENFLLSFLKMKNTMNAGKEIIVITPVRPVLDFSNMDVNSELIRLISDIAGVRSSIIYPVDNATEQLVTYLSFLIVFKAPHTTAVMATIGKVKTANTKNMEGPDNIVRLFVT